MSQISSQFQTPYRRKHFMAPSNNTGNNIGFIGIAIIVGLTIFGFFLTSAVKTYRSFERTVTVRGLAEQEHIADVVIWPIQFTEASNTQADIYANLESNARKIVTFLTNSGIDESEISVVVPAVTDRSAQLYSGDSNAQFRYVGSQSVTVYSTNVEKVRSVMRNVAELGKQGVVITGQDYQSSTEYYFTRLNEIKPEMIEAATVEARKVAEKFAQDSNSTLGKIKYATQGQFTIDNRDMNNPHIKNIRVVSTIVYYLTD